MAKNTEQRRVEIITNASQSTASINQLRAASRMLYNDMMKLPQGSEEFKKAMDKWRSVDERFKQAQAEVKGLDNHMRQLNGTANGFWGTIKNTAAGVAVGNFFTMLGSQVASLMNMMVSGRVKISDEIRDIAKTTGLAIKDVEALNKEFRKIDTRSSTSELRKLAMEAGKLGKTSKEEVLKFVEDMDKINVALGADLGEDAIIQIGKMTKVYETGAMNIASAVNSVAQASEASEGYLVDFAARMGGAARTAKISAPDIIGYGAVLDMMGQNVEMSATALNNFTINFVKDTSAFEKAAGMRAGSLQKIIGEKGTNAGMIAFIEAMKQASESEADFLRRMEEVGIDGSRGAAVFLTLANNIDEVKKQQGLANIEFTKGTSILTEFNTKNEGFAANWDKLKKAVVGFFTNNVVIDGFEKLVNWMMNSSSEADKLVSAFEDQQKTVNKLQGDILPLLNRYDELKSKAYLNKGEQAELKKIITEVGDVMPGVITQFDKYGEAMDINSGKAKEFVKKQALALKSMNRDAILALREQIVETKKSRDKAKEKLEYYKNYAENFAKEHPKWGRPSQQSIDEQQSKWIPYWQAKVAERQKKIDEDFARLQQLKGEDILAVADAQDKENNKNKEGGGGGGSGSGGDDKKKKTASKGSDLLIEGLKESFKEAEQQLSIWANAQDVMVKNAYAANALNQEQYQAELLENERLHLEAKRDLYVQFGRNTTEIDEQIADLQIKIKQNTIKQEKELSKEQDEEEKRRQKELMEFLKQFSKGASEDSFKYKMQLLDEQLRLDLEKYKLTEEQKEMITRYYEEKKAKLRQEKIVKDFEQFQEYASAALTIYNNISTLATNLENRNLQEKKRVEQENLAVLKNRYDAGVIQEEEYQAKVAEIQEEYRQQEREIRKRQFQRQKIANAVEATINTAVAVTKALGTLNPVLPILVGIAGAAQVAAILAQPVPEFAAGGSTVDVTGESGRRYNARRGRASGYHSSPTYIVGEKGGELVIPNWLYRAPAAMNLMGALEASIAQRSTGPLRGGGDAMTASTLAKLNETLESGLEVKWDQVGYQRYQANWQAAEQLNKL